MQRERSIALEKNIAFGPKRRVQFYADLYNRTGRETGIETEDASTEGEGAAQEGFGEEIQISRPEVDHVTWYREGGDA